MVLTNCAVSGNAATDRGRRHATRSAAQPHSLAARSAATRPPCGAGLFNSGGTLTVDKARSRQHGQTGNGGGLDSDDGTATLTSRHVTGNTAGTAGGVARGRLAER